MKSSQFELLFLLISTHALCHMTRRWTPVQTNQTAISSSESAGTWMIGKILFLIFSIKNALTVSFFKAVYIIKWRSRVHDAVMTPTQMISDFYSVSRERLNSCTFILYFYVHICTLWTDLGLIIYFLCFFKIPTIFSTPRLHWRVGELELEKTSK